MRRVKHAKKTQTAMFTAASLASLDKVMETLDFLLFLALFKSLSNIFKGLF